MTIFSSFCPSCINVHIYMLSYFLCYANRWFWWWLLWGCQSSMFTNFPARSTRSAMPPPINSSRTHSRGSWRATCPSNEAKGQKPLWGFLHGEADHWKCSQESIVTLSKYWPGKLSRAIVKDLGTIVWNSEENLSFKMLQRQKKLQELEDMQKLHAFRTNKIVSNIVEKFPTSLTLKGEYGG